MQSLLWLEIPDLFTSNFGVAAIAHMALITVWATWVPSGLPLDSPWWTERRWWESNGGQNHRKHRPRFLTEKPLRGRRAVCTRQEKVVHCRQTRTLSRAVSSSQLMVPQ